MRAESSVEKINRFMVELGKAVRSPGRVYFTGGVTAVLLGWRETTLDVDLKADPEPQGFFEALPGLKEALDINVELAAPDDFIPALPGWRDRSQHIDTQGALLFFHYDFYSQALSKIERFHARDQGDVQQMLSTGLVQRERLWELFQAIEPGLIRYPAIDATGLRQRVNTIVSVHSYFPMPPIQPNDFDGLPGADAIRAGLKDLAAGRESVESLLIQIGAPRLNWLGIVLPVKPELDADRRLYRRLAEEHGNAAHSQFNSLIRLLVSFERALERRLGARQRALNSTG